MRGSRLLGLNHDFPLLHFNFAFNFVSKSVGEACARITRHNNCLAGSLYQMEFSLGHADEQAERENSVGVVLSFLEESVSEIDGRVLRLIYFFPSALMK
jgi:hypothetical protein